MGRSEAGIEHQRALSRARSRRRYAEKAEQIQEQRRERYRLLRETAISRYGGRCCVCGETRTLALDIEHKDGGGAEDYRKKHRLTYYKTLAEGPLRDDLQIMCGSCHNIKTRGGDPYEGLG